MSVAGGLFVSFRPGYVVQATAVLVPGLLMFLWGLLGSGQKNQVNQGR